MKFCLVLAALLAVVAAEPFYGGIGYGYDYVSPHPTGVSFIRQSRLDGLGYRGKRDAEADAYGYGGYGYGRGVAGHYGGGSSYVGPTIWGLRGKRSAEPFYGYGYGRGVAGHYGGGSSYVGPTVWGLGRKKRDADADAYFGYGGYGYGVRDGAIAFHPTGTSFTARSPQGLRGKRSAEPFGYGFNYNALSGNSFIARSGVGYYPGGVLTRGKRSAEPGWGYNYNALSGNSFIRRSGVGYYPGGVFSG